MKKSKLSFPISIAMIAYNEQSNIEKVIQEYYDDIFVYLPHKSEFLIYLDSPTDRTPQIVKRLAKKLPVTVILGKKNLGYAESMKTVLKKTKNNVVFYSDSSGKHRAKDFWNLIPFIQSYDIITGDRSNRSDPLIRQIITLLQRILVVTIFNVPFHDYNTGFKILKRPVIQTVVDSCKFTKQSFSTELSVRALHHGFKIANKPVSFISRNDKKQGTNFKQLPGIILHNLKGLLQIKLELLRK